MIRIKDALYSFVTFSDLIVGAIVTEEIPVLQLFAILFLISDILKASFPNASSEKLKENLNTIAIMLDSMFDYGYPCIT
jgi:AP-3 complex subunit mu